MTPETGAAPHAAPKTTSGVQELPDARAREHAPRNCRPRFRRPVHATDRAPHPRAAGVSPRFFRAPRRSKKFARSNRSGIVLSGGPSSVYDADAPVCDPKVLQLGVPVLGICYGMQWLAHTLGGKVDRAEAREYGRAQLDIDEKHASTLFGGLPGRLKIWNSHGDHVVGLPAGFHVTGRTDNAVAAVEHPARRFYGVEFHPEVNHTDRGTEILQNFVFDICGAKKNWNRAGFIAATVDSIRKQAEGARAICALSGGVDSAVAAALVHRAIGDRLTNVFVDTGLLRRNEFRRHARTPARPPRPQRNRRGCLRTLPRPT